LPHLNNAQADTKLVTANAKAFNPPGTIYHTEAERIEAYALDQITKSASIVIEYETDWTVNVDGDDADLNIEDDDDVEPDTAAPGSPIGPEGRSTRSPSFADLAWGRRPPQRAAVRKAAEKDFQQQQQQVKLPDKPSEKAPLPTLDEEGHMPGYRDGVGRFPPDSDWAPVMLALKLKGVHRRVSTIGWTVLTCLFLS
jgi:bromodomain-containing protein 7